MGRLAPQRHGHQVEHVGQLVRTRTPLRARSRCGWNMTSLLPELADMPAVLVLHGEVITSG